MQSNLWSCVQKFSDKKGRLRYQCHSVAQAEISGPVAVQGGRGHMQGRHGVQLPPRTTMHTGRHVAATLLRTSSTTFAPAESDAATATQWLCTAWQPSAVALPTGHFSAEISAQIAVLSSSCARALAACSKPRAARSSYPFMVSVIHAPWQCNQHPQDQVACRRFLRDCEGVSRV